MSVKLNTTEILKGIKNNIFTVTNNEQQGTSKNILWDTFLKIKYVDKNQFIDFVQCSLCKSILSYSSKSGTSHLHRHTKNCNEALNHNQPKIDCCLRKRELEKSGEVSIFNINISKTS